MEKSTQIAELKAEIDRLAKKIAELEKQPEKTAKERWEEEYKKEHKKLNYKEDIRLIHYTKESYSLWLEQLNLMFELQTFAKLRNGDWVADWKYEDQLKVGIVLPENKAKIGNRVNRNDFVYGISFKSTEIAQEALEIFGERVEKYYGK